MSALLALAASAGAAPADSNAPDPYLWLEAVTGADVDPWVARQRQQAEGALQALPVYPQLQREIQEVLDSPSRIPAVQQLGDGQLYNFWRDAAHPRGVWRRTSLANFQRTQPEWETVLDLDQLAQQEGESWVWQGVSCLAPKDRRCLVSLSRGGTDARVVREFDTGTRAFVAGGFVLPEAKGGLSWVDGNHVAVYTDFGPGTLTESGYPRQLKLWQRGQALDQAKPLLEIPPSDMSLWTWTDSGPEGSRVVVERRRGFFDGEQYLLERGKLREIPKPLDATVTPFGDQLLIELRSDWQVGGRSFKAGSLLATPLAAFMAGQGKDFQLLFEPHERSGLQSVTRTRDALLLVHMDEVRQQLSEWRRERGRWVQRRIETPAFASLWVSPLAGRSSNAYLLTQSSFLQPSTLELGEAGRSARQTLKTLPAFFDAAGLQVQQLHATSKDGTRVPYFVVGAQAANGPRPTLLYGYGGFEISMRPNYSGITGRAWLARGGQYVLANIRGGGEFGPRWHQSAQKAGRQRSYDDFIAVAEDLQRRGLTTPKQLGILGGSLGGMLVQVAMQQRPELFGAVVSQVPLSDMKRYHRLLAGASWMAEYGDPDQPSDWEVIGAYSPYHNSKPDARYPPILYTSSTRDDRVHPAHARKMVALMQSQGHKVLYWENGEGGHAGAANNAQAAAMWALSYSFLIDTLMK
ncbi:prolyl oligopeptidase family serine peptidase [Inhella proteolytica]|uniref:S9 family peptidase n=1 Tax=Inhella proteolytica TaxID=2795029 RepID=A0A931J7C3_9BURK|nr:prolyl oligopeptidase family serine peptidase [Inhella proteolytica]MBH9579581.1 S9 family peptidase [Inhella proteolytica]